MPNFYLYSSKLWTGTRCRLPVQYYPNWVPVQVPSLSVLQVLRSLSLWLAMGFVESMRPECDLHYSVLQLPVQLYCLQRRLPHCNLSYIVGLLVETRPSGVDLGAESGSLKVRGRQAPFPEHALLFCLKVELFCWGGDCYGDSTGSIWQERIVPGPYYLQNKTHNVSETFATLECFMIPYWSLIP